MTVALTPFETAVDGVLRSLRRGDVVSYGDVAVEAGFSRQASRSVGGFLSKRGDDYPWWRVVMADGRLAPGKEADQGRRLRSEGVTVVGDRVAAAG